LTDDERPTAELDPDPVAATDSAASIGHHDALTHMDAPTVVSDDDHGHAEPRLGPIDWAAWAYALIGATAGAIVIALFWFAVT
jgi:hypothetical protein